MNTSPLILCLSLAHTQTARSTQTYSFHILLLWQCKCCRWDNLLRKPLIEIVVYHWIYARDYLTFYSHHFDSSYTLPATVLLGQFYLVNQWFYSYLYAYRSMSICLEWKGSSAGWCLTITLLRHKRHLNTGTAALQNDIYDKWRPSPQSALIFHNIFSV